MCRTNIDESKISKQDYKGIRRATTKKLGAEPTKFGQEAEVKNQKQKDIDNMFGGSEIGGSEVQEDQIVVRQPSINASDD